MDEALNFMLATDFQPFSLVNDKRFKNFVHNINPNYKIPDKRTVRYELMPKMFHQAKTKQKKYLI